MYKILIHGFHYLNLKTNKMRVKNMLRVAAFATVMAITIPARSNTLTNTMDASQPTTSVPAANEVRAEEIKNRLEEIKAMDKSTLTRAEKKALKTEVKAMKKEARATNGVYISVGALIIIILLLILIL
jgi:hypothetical protein